MVNMRYLINSTNTVIIADPEFVEAHHAGDYTIEVEEVILRTNRYISVGSFFDRFGPLKWAILADPNLGVQAVIKDCSVRKYIDLDNPDLPRGLDILVAAGHNIDSYAIINSIITPNELP